MCCALTVYTDDGQNLRELFFELYPDFNDPNVGVSIQENMVKFHRKESERTAHNLSFQTRMKLTKMAIGFLQHSRGRGYATGLIQPGDPCETKEFSATDEVTPSQLCMAYKKET